ncbi:MAG: ammonia-forming cytochrome c nitrite reductase subunit c552 [Candidatus Korobacteraceae bacterium]|jgi:nitrite reductase (cytochrome c-552)
MTTNTSTPGASARRTTLLIVIVAVATVAVLALLISIFERKQEARNTFVRVVDITDDTEDPAIWGKNFPAEYETFMKTIEMRPTKYGGSESIPHTPTDQDPRTKTSRSKIEADPRFITMWAGYAFSKDYRERRGHYYALDDQTFTQRQVVVKQPGTCMNCHASMYVPYKKAGDGDIFKGFEKINSMPYTEARKLAKHSLACIDCHDPKTMQLRVTRPAFLEGIRALKASQGIQDYDPNKQASRQEMRTYVCAQCHVEYYFKGDQKRLVYPWAKGVKIENIQAYYDQEGFKDWVHKDTGANVLKAQHPEFELWSQGIHARSGVACADCHMPYMRQGGTKVSDHQVRSPLLNINRACQTCHRWDEKELKDRVEQIQYSFRTERETAFNALIDLIKEITAARNAGASDEQLAKPRDFQRKAQFYFDFIEAENSVGFHAPQEAQRVLGESLNLSRLGQLALRDAMKSAPVVKAASQPAAVPAPKKGN